MIPTFTIDVLLYDSVNDNAIISPQSGALLVAHPLMDDPNFLRTVILLIAHDDSEGSMGVVLNRPDLTSHHDSDSPLQRWIHSAAPPYFDFIGGPVEETGFICLRRDTSTTSGVASVDIASDSPVSSEPHRVFRGYSGWGPHQLAGEVTQQGWFVVPSFPDDAFDSEPDTLWSRVIARQLGDVKKLSRFPHDPTMN